VAASPELGGLTSRDLQLDSVTLAVPVGSLEQHGPHLPLDTDTRIATAVARSVADQLGHVVAPAISYGASGEHQEFPGTVSIGTAALTAVLLEYGRSACEWAGRVVFVNGHGGNVDALRAAAATLRAEGRDATWCSGWSAGGDAHAGHTETSLLLHLSPHVVRRDRWVTGNRQPLAELLPALRRDGIGAVSPSGVLGDPTTATPAAGARIFADMVDDCVRRVLAWSPDRNGMLR
jgi:mycofactocin system creatininase family protein